MSIAQTQPLVDDLVKAKIPRKTATELVDFIEKQQSNTLKKDIEWLKWIVGIGFTFLLTIMVYLHSDVKSNIGKVDDRIGTVEDRIGKVEDRIGKVEARLEKVEARINQMEINITQKLNQLLRKSR